MGVANSSSEIQRIDPTQHAELFDQSGQCKFYRDCQTGVEYEKYYVDNVGKDDFQNKYQFRIQHPSSYLVTAYYAKASQNAFGCTSSDKFEVVTERIPVRLFNLSKMQEKLSFQMLFSSLKGFNQIYKSTNLILVKDSMIGMNKDGKTKVWMNENFAFNQPVPQPLSYSMLPSNQKQSTMVDNIIELINSRTQRTQNWVHFIQSKYSRGRMCFSQAIQLVKQHIKNNGYQEDRSKLQEKIGGIQKQDVSTIKKQQNDHGKINIVSSGVRNQEDYEKHQVSYNGKVQQNEHYVQSVPKIQQSNVQQFRSEKQIHPHYVNANQNSLRTSSLEKPPLPPNKPLLMNVPIIQNVNTSVLPSVNTSLANGNRYMAAPNVNKSMSSNPNTSVTVTNTNKPMLVPNHNGPFVNVSNPPPPPSVVNMNKGAPNIKFGYNNNFSIPPHPHTIATNLIPRSTQSIRQIQNKQQVKVQQINNVQKNKEQQVKQQEGEKVKETIIAEQIKTMQVTEQNNEAEEGQKMNKSVIKENIGEDNQSQIMNKIVKEYNQEKNHQEKQQNQQDKLLQKQQKLLQKQEKLEQLQEQIVIQKPLQTLSKGQLQISIHIEEQLQQSKKQINKIDQSLKNPQNNHNILQDKQKSNENSSISQTFKQEIAVISKIQNNTQIIDSSTINANKVQKPQNIKMTKKNRLEQLTSSKNITYKDLRDLLKSTRRK